MEISSDSAIFKKNRAMNAVGNGFFMGGANTATFEGNICELMGGDCVDVGGNNVIARKNSVIGSGGRAELVNGDDALIEGNKAVGSGSGVFVSGAEPQVLKNSATGSANFDAIFVTCGTSCTTARVEGNRANVTPNNIDCFDLGFDFPGGQVLKNTGVLCNDQGMEVRGLATVRVESNIITRAGAATGNAFDVSGTGVKTLVTNKASRAGGSGFRISEAAHILDKNSARSNVQNGFHLVGDADSSLVARNNASGNGEEGIHNDAGNVTFIDNKAKGNSPDQDFCVSAANGGGINLNSAGNDFGSTTPPNQAIVCINE